jgi:hypothetical protein
MGSVWLAVALDLKSLINVAQQTFVPAVKGEGRFASDYTHKGIV